MSESTQQIHASCVAIDSHAVVLRGPSGVGKSDIALRLIDGGAMLVADDRTDLTVGDDALWASVPDTIAGLLEIRGLGIVRRPFLSPMPVALIVDVMDEAAVPRMPVTCHETIMGIRVPLMAASAIAASTPAKIRIALALDAKDMIEPT